jgi:ribosome-associated protein
LLKKATEIKKARKKTKPTSASKTKRIETKKKRGQLKKLREKPKNIPE